MKDQNGTAIGTAQTIDLPLESVVVSGSYDNTNKKIELKGYFNKKTKQTEKMKYPLSDLDNVNFSHYTLQLSIYAWMIQHNNPNFKIKLLRLIHFDHSGNITEYDVEYKKSTVERLLRYWKKLVKIEERKALRKEIEF